MKNHRAELIKQWETLLGKLERLARRERIQMMVMLVVVVGAAWSQLVLDPFRKEQSALRKQRTQIETGLRDMMTLEQEILARKDKDPDQMAKERIQVLEQEIATLDKQLGEGMLGMVSPTEMIPALQNLLSADSGLTLLSLEVPPPLNLMAGEEAGGTVYQHALVLRFSGAFPDVLKYLVTLEKLPWKLFWDEVEFAVVEFPKSYVTLRIHTLSLSEALIGGDKSH
ncbi:MAG: hypothetical protein HQL91_03835 [Magnetococcales bacterium]|nr:hypothetical protein [Magnetococcales bacterium]